MSRGGINMKLDLFNTFYDSKYIKETYFYEALSYVNETQGLGIEIKKVNDIEVDKELDVLLLKEVSTFECGIPSVDINYGLSNTEVTSEMKEKYPKTKFFRLLVSEKKENFIIESYMKQYAHRMELVKKLDARRK
jgi:hypothetical protein